MSSGCSRNKHAAKECLHCFLLFQGVCGSRWSLCLWPKQRHFTTGSEWGRNERRRAMKKWCCLAEGDITSDTNVKLTSSGTIGPLCTRRCRVRVAVTLFFTPVNIIKPLLSSSFPIAFSVSHPPAPHCASPHQGAHSLDFNFLLHVNQFLHDFRASL